MPKQKAEAWPPPESFLSAEEVGAVSAFCGRFLGWEPTRRIVGPSTQRHKLRLLSMMRYRPTIGSDFSVLVKLHRDGGIDTFKYRGSELICVASGSDFQSAMIHTTACGLALDETVDN